VDTPSALTNGLERLEKLEAAGRKGFLLQEVIDHGGRSLRVVIIGKQLYSYWKQQADKSQIWTNTKSGAVIDHTSDSNLQEAGRQAVQKICLSAGINLAGFDLLFSTRKNQSDPLFLEINYFFGRRGLGGSEKYYGLLDTAIRKWLGEIRISL
jgi:ribosomal protein S6--L-glutamate ligase